jgi:hypothetical protein
MDALIHAFMFSALKSISTTIRPPVAGLEWVEDLETVIIGWRSRIRWDLGAAYPFA